MHITYRSIVPEDNPKIARVIRTVLEEFNAAKPGTVYTDPTTDNLYDLFQLPKSTYFIAEENGQIIGGCGLFPTEGLPEKCTELVKLYLSPAARGKGIGKHLMELCFEKAVELGYNQVYLETLPELHIAVGLYEHLGFHYLEKPLGNSGHFACDLWMIKKL